MLRALPLSSSRNTSLASSIHDRGSKGPLRSSRRVFRCRAEFDEGTVSINSANEVGSAQSDIIEAARQSAEHAFSQTYNYVAADEPQDESETKHMRRKLEAIGRELNNVTEAEYRSLAATTAPPSPRRKQVDNLTRSNSGNVVVAPPAKPQQEVQQNIVPLTPRTVEKKDVTPEGTGREILLQGFNWESWKHNWFQTMSEKSQEIADMGFTTVWLPPFTDSVSEQGYMPRDLYNLNSKYGNEEQLINCVRALQQHNIKVLGDAVLNHRCANFQGAGGKWNQFGGKLAWDESAIVGDQHEYGGRGNKSSGDSFDAAPNIDHSQEFVKRDLCEWMQWLRNHVGFDGWRLDFVKGFHGSHVKDYMEASKPNFVVGEYWDSLAYEWDGTPCHDQDGHRQRIVNWINAAGGLATAFDITTKGIMHAVFERCEYWRLKDAAGKPSGLMGWWPSRSVTFLENHDTGSTQGHWRFPGHALEQGHAYILTHPGTPTVFWDHVFGNDQLRHVVQRLMDIRIKHGIHCRSQVKILRAERDVYAAEIDGKLVMKIGPGDFTPNKDANGLPTPVKHVSVDCGHCWAIWEKEQ